MDEVAMQQIAQCFFLVQCLKMLFLPQLTVTVVLKRCLVEEALKVRVNKKGLRDCLPEWETGIHDWYDKINLKEQGVYTTYDAKLLNSMYVDNILLAPS